MSKKNRVVTYLKSNFYNDKFINNKKKYILQCMAAGVVAFIVLLSLTSATNGFIIASIASSAFVVFTVPHSPRLRTHTLLGAYLIGSLAGVMCYYLLVGFHHITPMSLNFDRALFGALSVALSMFLMLCLKLMHPPACGVSLALVLNPWETQVLLITLGAIFILMGAHYLLKKYLINLV